jgi:hypothetical protein
LLTAFGSLYGVDGVRKLIMALPAPVGVALRDDIVSASGWYPLPWYGVLHRTAQEVTGEGLALARRLGYLSTQGDAKGIYRFVLSFVQPTLIVKHADRVLSLYLEGPRVTAEILGRTAGKVTIEDCPGADANVWEDVMGSTEAMIEGSAGKHAKVTLLAGGGDEPRISFRGEWQR